MQQVRRNMIELSSFAADKLCKTVYFDTSIPLEDRIQKAEEYGKRLSELAEACLHYDALVVCRSTTLWLEHVEW